MRIDVFASGSSGNAYRISDGVTTLLLDAGIPFKQLQIACDFKLHDLGGALITHRHGDHSKAVRALSEYGVDIYANSDVVAASHPVAHRAHVLNNLVQFEIGTFSIKPFDVEHDVPNMGFLIESSATGDKLLYFTDCNYIRYKFSGLTHIMAECNYSIDVLQDNVVGGALQLERAERVIRSHMELNTLLDMLAAGDLSTVRQIYLLHISNDNGREAEFVRRVKEMTGCEVYAC